MRRILVIILVINTIFSLTIGIISAAQEKAPAIFLYYGMAIFGRFLVPFLVVAALYFLVKKWVPITRAWQKIAVCSVLLFIGIQFGLFAWSVMNVLRPGEPARDFNFNTILSEYQDHFAWLWIAAIFTAIAIPLIDLLPGRNKVASPGPPGKSTRNG